MPVRVLHAADIHLGRACAHLGPRASARQDDLFDTFGRICALAIDRRVDALLIAGDLFDVHDPSDALVGRVQAEFERMRAAGIPVFVIPGNHDEYSYPRCVWKQHAFPGTHVFTDPQFTDTSFQADGIPVHIHGLAYDHAACRDPLPTLAPTESGLHIAMMHASIDVPQYQQVEQRYLPLSSSQLLNLGVQYVALGHIHRAYQYRDQSDVHACYPGSPEGLTMRETGARFVALLEFAGGRPAVEMIPVNRRTVERASISVDDMTESQIALALASHAGPDILLDATLVGAPRDVPRLDAIRARAGDGFFWLDLEDDTALADSARVEEIAGENTIRGQFVRAMRERIRAASDEEERATLELALKLAFLELEKRSAA